MSEPMFEEHTRIAGAKETGGSGPTTPAATGRRPQLGPDVDPSAMERMKTSYERDVASGNMAPGNRFLNQALQTRSGSGTAMSVNDVAGSVHEAARSSGAKVAGKAAKTVLGGDPAKLLASSATVVQAGAQALDQTDPGRRAEYARSKRVYEKTSTDRHGAIEALHSEKIHEGEQLTEDQQAHRSEVVRNAWRATSRNIGKGLRTAALAKASGNGSELLSENAMKHTVGKKTDLQKGDVAQESDIVSGSTYGDLKRKVTKGNSQKLSGDRKATLEQLEAHQEMLEGQSKAEIALRKIGVSDTGDLTGDPTNAYSFMDEQSAKKQHQDGISDLEKTANEQLKARKQKSGTLGLSSTQVLHADEQKTYDASKSEYDSATSEAVALREAHLKKHTDAYNALHARTTGKTARFFGRTNELTEAETQKKKYHHAEMTRLAAPHALENLRGYMSEDQLARANPHAHTMKNLESVRDTGLTLDQHDTMAEHKSGLAEIANRKETGLSRSDQAELAQTKRRIGLVYESQREHNTAIKDNLGKTAGVDGRFGGVDRGNNVDPSTYQRTTAGTIAQGAVASAEGLRTGARILKGSDKDARAALDSRKFGEAALTGGMGAFHEIGGIVAQSTGVPIDTKGAVKPVTGLMHGSADVLEGLAGDRADKEDGRTVQREFSTEGRLAKASKTPVDWMGSTDHGQAPRDSMGLVKAGLSEVDENLSDTSTTYSASKEHVQDSVSSAMDKATAPLTSIAAPLPGALVSPVEVPRIKAPETPEMPDIAHLPKTEELRLDEPSLPTVTAPTSLTAPNLQLPEHEVPKIEAPQIPDVETLPALPDAPNAEALALHEPNLSPPDASIPELHEPELHGPDTGQEEDQEASGKEDEDDDKEWWSETGEKTDDPAPATRPASPEQEKRPALNLGEIEQAGAKSALLHKAVGDRSHREGISTKNTDGMNGSQVQHLGADLRSQIHAAGAWSSKNHEGSVAASSAVSDATKKEYNSVGSRLSRFSRNLSLRARNAYKESGISGGVRSVGQSLWSGVRSLFGGKARNYGDPIENRQREEEAKKAKKATRA